MTFGKMARPNHTPKGDPGATAFVHGNLHAARQHVAHAVLDVQAGRLRMAEVRLCSAQRELDVLGRALQVASRGGDEV